MTTQLFAATRGAGDPALLIHGSAADHSTWTLQLAGLQGRFAMIAIDRRGTERSPLPEGVTMWTVEQHADDAAETISAHASGPVLACGSSFGAVVALELARRHPALVRGLVLCEPPVAAADELPNVPEAFGCHFDRLVAEQGGEAAAEYFLRTALTDAAFARIPDSWRARACGMWRQIRADIAALGRYRVGYDRLARDITAPALVIGGARSADYFRPTLEAFEDALADVRVQIIADTGHMMHLDSHHAFNAALVEFADGIVDRR